MDPDRDIRMDAVEKGIRREFPGRKAKAAEINLNAARTGYEWAKENLPDAEYGSSQKIWQNKADFDSKIPAVLQAIADAKTSVKDEASVKTAFETIDAKCNLCHDTYRLKLK